MSAPLNSNECQKPLTGQNIAENIEQIGAAMGLSQECVKEAQNQFSSGQMSGSVNIPFVEMKASASFTQANNEMRQAGCGQFFVNASDQLTSTHNMVCTLEKNSNKTQISASAGGSISVTNDWSPEFFKIATDAYNTASANFTKLETAIANNPPQTEFQYRIQQDLLKSAKEVVARLKPNPPKLKVKESVLENDVKLNVNSINNLSSQAISDVTENFQQLTEQATEAHITNNLGTSALTPNVKQLISRTINNQKENLQQTVREQLNSTNISMSGNNKIVIRSTGQIDIIGAKLSNNTVIDLAVSNLFDSANSIGISTATNLISRAADRTEADTKVAGINDLADSLAKGNTDAIDKSTSSDNTVMYIIIGVIALFVLIGGIFAIQNSDKLAAAARTTKTGF